MRQTLEDFGYNLTKVPLVYDNQIVVRLVDNPIDNDHTKHIDIQYHFLRDHSQRGYIVIDHVSSHNQLADIFTNSLDEKCFCELRIELNVIDSRNVD
jgi:streptomycin 6-kinase